MNHPFFAFSRKQHLTWLGIFTAIALALTVAFFWINMRLINEAAPAGILSFEFAGTLTGARMMMHSWDYSAKIWAAFGLGLDFIYLIAYSTCLSLICVYIARSWVLFNSFSKAGLLVAWLQWGAALFDGVENVALIALLSDSNREWLVSLAYWMATGKFTLIGIAFLYVLAGFFGLWWQIRTNK
ncbi:hypothetical protein [Rhodoflexus sp.]